MLGLPCHPAFCLGLFYMCPRKFAPPFFFFPSLLRNMWKYSIVEVNWKRLGRLFCGRQHHQQPPPPLQQQHHQLTLRCSVSTTSSKLTIITTHCYSWRNGVVMIGSTTHGPGYLTLRKLMQIMAVIHNICDFTSSAHLSLYLRADMGMNLTSIACQMQGIVRKRDYPIRMDMGTYLSNAACQMQNTLRKSDYSKAVGIGGPQIGCCYLLYTAQVRLCCRPSLAVSTICSGCRWRTIRGVSLRCVLS